MFNSFRRHCFGQSSFNVFNFACYCAINFFLSIFILIQNTIFRLLWTMHVIDECICDKIRGSFAILQEIGHEQIDSIVSPFFSVRICELKTAF